MRANVTPLSLTTPTLSMAGFAKILQRIAVAALFHSGSLFTAPARQRHVANYPSCVLAAAYSTYDCGSLPNRVKVSASILNPFFV